MIHAMPVVMSPAVCTLLCFAALTAILPLAYAGYRVVLVLARRASPAAWTREAQTWEDPELITRLRHAHLNCVENLPVYAAVVLGAWATQQLAVVDALAGVFLGLRLAQTTTHAISAGPAFVFIRANFWILQMVLVLYWISQLCGWL